jgi:uncharacterized integral membrane protein
MSFSFTIPMWLFWAIGIPLGLIILFCAWIGIMFLDSKNKRKKSTKQSGEIRIIGVDIAVMGGQQ